MGRGRLGGGRKSEPMGSSLRGALENQPTLLSMPKFGTAAFSAAMTGDIAANASRAKPAEAKIHFIMKLLVRCPAKLALSIAFARVILRRGRRRKPRRP